MPIHLITVADRLTTVKEIKTDIDELNSLAIGLVGVC